MYMLCMWRGEVKDDRNSGDLSGDTLEEISQWDSRKWEK